VARRRLAVGLVASLALIAIRVGHSAQGQKVVATPVVPRLSAPPSLAGAKLFPRNRVVAYAGGPQSPKLGPLGVGGTAQAAQLTQQASSYLKPGQPVIPAFELVAVVASKQAGADGAFRVRQSTATIQRYLQAARRVHAFLVLDIQPGHSDFMTEAKLLEPFLKMPDVGLALDPRWNVPLGTVPGDTPGSVAATDVNAIAEYLDGVVSANNLPQKLMLVHSASAQMVLPKFGLRALPNVAEAFVVEGAGSAATTQARYQTLTANLNPAIPPGLRLPSTTGPGAAEASGLAPAPRIVVYG